MKTINFICVLLLLNLNGCATVDITRNDAQIGDAATRRFSEFDRFFIKPLKIDDNLKDSHNNEQASAIININLYNDFLAVFNTLDYFSEYDKERPEKTLIIKPVIEKLKSVGRVTRVFTGVLAGGSAVVLKITYIDAETKEIIANPSFYQHANAWAAAYKRSSDRKMLDRITKLAAAYAADNY